jgi:hypothetical protein
LLNPIKSLINGTANLSTVKIIREAVTTTDTADKKNVARGQKTGDTTLKNGFIRAFFVRQRGKICSEQGTFLKQRHHFFSERKEQNDQQV